MKAASLAALCLLGSIATASAQTGGDREADAVGSSLSEILSFATLGALGIKDQAPQVEKSGDDYLVRLPLKGFSTPADAAVKGVAHPLNGGLWDITSMTFPSAGTVETKIPGPEPHAAGPNGGQATTEYSIGEQTIHAKIDPGFAQPSSFAATLGTIAVRSDRGDVRSEQTIDRYQTDATLSSEPGGQLDFVSRASMADWHLIAHTPSGPGFDGTVRKVSAHVSVQALDRAQGTRMMAAVRAAMGNRAPPGAPPGGPLTLAQRQDLRAIVDSLAGLLGNLAADETLEDIRFSAGPASGAIGRIHANIAGSSMDDRVNARMDMAVDALALAGLPADSVAFLPHQVALKTALEGVPAAQLMALLRAAAGPNPDQAALQAGLTALLSDPGAKVGIEELSFDAGPLRVKGTARVVKRANGVLGADIHMWATGLDALIAQAQGKPSLQQGIPFMFMAKGMGRPDGGATVWDISVGGGPVTINGTPLGQGGARTR